MTELNEGQQKAIELAEKIRDNEHYPLRDRMNMVYGMVRLSVSLGAYSDKLKAIWGNLEIEQGESK